MNDTQRTTAPVMSMGDWMVTLLLGSIPILNFILLIVWALSSTENPNKSNFAKAALVWMAVLFVLYFFLFAAVLGSIAGNM